MIFSLIIFNQNIVKSKIVLIWFCFNDYKDIAEDFKTRFYTSNYELDRPLPKRIKKEVIDLMKNQLGGKAMAKAFGLGAITCSH